MRKKSYMIGNIILVLLDLVCIIASNAGAFYFRFNILQFPFPKPPLQPYISLWILTTLSILLGFYWQKSYVFPRRSSLSECFQRVFKVVSLTFIFLIVLIFISRGLSPRVLFRFSRLTFFFNWIFLFISLLFVRFVMLKFERILFGWNKIVCNVAILGSGAEAEGLKHRIEEKFWLGYKVKGFINERDDHSDWGWIYLGKPAEISRIVRKEQLDEIIFLQPDQQDLDVLETLRIALECDVKIHMSPMLFHFLLSQIQIGARDSLIAADEQNTTEQMMNKVSLDIDRFYTKIAMIGLRGIPATYGGVEKAVDQISIRLVEQGFEIYVYCRSYYTSLIGKYRGVHLIRLPTINTKHLDTSIHTIVSTIHAIFKGFDIIHYHAMGPSMLSLIPRLFGIKTVVTVQGLDWKRDKWGEFARSILKLGEFTSIRFPSKTIVVSKTLRDYFNKRYNLSVSYIPNGIPVPKLLAANRIVKEYNLEKDNYILFVGRLVPEKGCHHLIQAFTSIDTDKKLVIVGGSSHSDAYVDALHKMATDRVIFTGYVYDDRLDELFTNAYVYVLPSKLEGLPISLLEALSYGICVLSSDIPENLEILQQSRNGAIGFSFKQGEIKDLQSKIQYLLENPDVVEDIGKKARDFVQKHFSWDKIANDIDNAYHFLLKNK